MSIYKVEKGKIKTSFGNKEVKGLEKMAVLYSYYKEKEKGKEKKN